MSEMLAVARGVALAYGQHVALRRSDFEIPLVGTTAVIGPNGSGKSTLLSALVGLVPTVSGSLQVLGGSPAAARGRISYVLQSTPVSPGMPITVREAVTMGCYPQLGLFRPSGRKVRSAVDDAMARMNIADLANRHLHELSGGQRQRVLVAQGLVQPHDVLLLDEPLTGLDVISAKTIDDLIHGSRSDGGSVVLTTHDLDEARAADWVVLVSGQVVACGPPGQVCTREHLEVAFGLGSLHAWEGFLDDPHEH